jgi:DNA-binding response OmpR family regulator
MLTEQFLATENSRLKRENEDLHEQVFFWKSTLSTDFQPPLEWGLTRSQCIIFQVLLARPMASREAIYCTLYGGGTSRDPKLIDVMLSRMRPKLKKFDIIIRTLGGRGWYLDEPVRQQLKKDTRQ